MKSRVFKKDEFREFIKTLKEGQIKHWKTVADSIGVDQDTITYWKSLPEAQDAMSIGIINALEQMEVSGKKDWRMWRETANILALGLNPEKKVAVEVNDPRKDILDKYLGGNDAGQTEEAESRPPADSA